MIWYRYSNRAISEGFLHDDMAATLPDFRETMFLKNNTYLLTGKRIHLHRYLDPGYEYVIMKSLIDLCRGCGLKKEFNSFNEVGA